MFSLSGCRVPRPVINPADSATDAAINLFIDEDSKVVMRISCLAERYKGYFDRMMESVNSDNFADIYKLAFFTYNSFTSNYHYLESLRDGIRFAVDGVTYYGSGEDSQGEFSEFFEEVFPIVVGKEKVYKKVEV